MRSFLLTPLSLLLLGAGGALLYFAPNAAVFASVNGALLILVAVDFCLLPSGREIEAVRTVKEIISAGEPAAVIVQLRISGRKGRRISGIRGKDEIPDGFESSSRELPLIREQENSYRGEYSVLSRRRGDFYFGRFNLRCRGPLGLVIRQYALDPGNGPVRVYPGLKLVPRHELFALRTSRRQPGLRASRLISLGTEFETLKEYTPDDDYRQINWKASARSGKLITNHYQVEKSQNLILVFEAGRMMMTETGGFDKLDHALNAGLLLGFYALSSGDLVGAMAFSDSVKTYLPPGSHREQIRKISRALYRLQPRRVEPDYGRAFIYLANRQKKRSMVCIFTDLVDIRASGELIENALILSKRHLVLFVVVGDGFLHRTISGEITRPLEVYRKAVVEQYLLEREQGMAYLRNRGVDVVELLPGTDPAIVINRYINMKGGVRL